MSWHHLKMDVFVCFVKQYQLQTKYITKRELWESDVSSKPQNMLMLKKKNLHYTVVTPLCLRLESKSNLVNVRERP